jgi:cyclase
MASATSVIAGEEDAHPSGVRGILSPFPGCDFRAVRQSSGTREKTHAYHWLISIHASGVRKTAKFIDRRYSVEPRTDTSAPWNRVRIYSRLAAMASNRNRRDFIKTAAGGMVGMGLSSRLFAQAGGPSLTTTKLADNYTLISGAGSNVLVLTQPEGVLMVDGGVAEHSADLLKAAAGLSPAGRIQVLFNTHWHLEHTGSNDALGKAGAKIIAHENTKLWMGAEIISMWQHHTYEPRPKDARPNTTFYTSGKLTFGKEEVRYGYLGQAHTDGDIYVFFPGPNILMTGDVFTVGTYPILDYTTGGWIGGLSDATKTLAGLADAQTRVVPGNGPVKTKADLEAQSAMCATMRTRFVEMMRKGMSAKDMLGASPTKEFDATWGDPTLFITNAYPGLWGHVREIGGIV